jgi:hypothetical protein
MHILTKCTVQEVESPAKNLVHMYICTLNFWLYQELHIYDISRLNVHIFSFVRNSICFHLTLKCFIKTLYFQARDVVLERRLVEIVYFYFLLESCNTTKSCLYLGCHYPLLHQYQVSQCLHHHTRCC